MRERKEQERKNQNINSNINRRHCNAIERTIYSESDGCLPVTVSQSDKSDQYGTVRLWSLRVRRNLKLTDWDLSEICNKIDREYKFKSTGTASGKKSCSAQTLTNSILFVRQEGRLTSPLLLVYID